MLSCVRESAADWADENDVVVVVVVVVAVVGGGGCGRRTPNEGSNLETKETRHVDLTLHVISEILVSWQS